MRRPSSACEEADLLRRPGRLRSAAGRACKSIGERTAGRPARLSSGRTAAPRRLDPLAGAAEQRDTAELQRHRSGRRVNQVVAERAGAPSATPRRDLDEARLAAAQRVRADPVSAEHLLGIKGWSRGSPAHHGTTGEITKPGRSRSRRRASRPPRRRPRPRAQFLFDLAQHRVEQLLARIESAAGSATGRRGGASRSDACRAGRSDAPPAAPTIRPSTSSPSSKPGRPTGRSRPAGSAPSSRSASLSITTTATAAWRHPSSSSRRRRRRRGGGSGRRRSSSNRITPFGVPP